MIIVPKNWAEFQHYKERKPPWIKLHRGLLDNFEYQSLPVSSRALAPMLWLIASDHDRGEINAAPENLAFRLRMQKREVTDAIQPLIDSGFFVVVHSDSDALAGRVQAATPEKSRDRERGEEKAREFDEFWKAYPKKESKRDAQAAWAKVDAPLTVILAAIETRKKTIDWQKAGGQFVPLPATWLRAKRWEDVLTTDHATTSKDPDSRSSVEAEAFAKGIGPWNELAEQWPTYKARVRAQNQKTH